MEVWVNLAKVSYEDARKALNGIATKKPVHVNVFNPETPSNDPRANWTHKDWEKQDPEGLFKMKRENNTAYNRLFDASYKK